MRKLALALAMAVAAAGTGLAAVQDTPHNITAAGGVCSNCHVPHLAGGARLWPASETAAPKYGVVGPLCYSCHDGTIATSTDVTTTAWRIGDAPGATGANSGSHGLNINTAGAAVTYVMPNTVVSTTMPYGDNTATKRFECSTCHDPHGDAGTVADSLGLLRIDIDSICDNCHTGRGTGDGTWGTTYGVTNPGYHPVGTDVWGNNNAGDSPIDIGIGNAPGASALDAPYTDGTRHILSGHLTEGATVGADGNGVTCVTCHAVHGPDDGGTQASVPEDLLAIAQGVATGAAAVGEGFTANSGLGVAVNALLCESCHGAAGSTWNPGGTAFSHPANGLGHNINQDIAQIPANWPYSSAIYLTAGNSPTCESCHAAHGSAVASTPILRGAWATICEQCHANTNQIAGHHPVGAGLLTASAMQDATIGNGDGTLSCQDCHNAASGGAHNWTSAGMPGLDPDWLPNTSAAPTVYSDNGREDASYTPGTGVIALADQSRTCLNCHTNGNARQAPTRYTADNDATAYGEYQDAGDGTHWLGTTTLAWANGELPRGTAFNATTAQWPLGGYSRFGGTTAALELVCESCHSVNVGWNDNYTIANRATTSLLLAVSNENTVEEDSGFCEGCHGHDPQVSTPHPMSNDPVSKAVDAGGVGPSTLLTFGQSRTVAGGVVTASYMNVAANTNNTFIPATNDMNCNSCHQPHDTPTGFGTWILDAPSGHAPGGTAPAASGTLYGAAYNLDGTGWANGYQQLCYDCHAY